MRSQALPAPADSADVDGLRVALAEGAAGGRSPSSRFTVTRDGTPVAIQDYLGAEGHLVALREGDLAFLHVHPDENRLRFDGRRSRPRAATACSCSSRPPTAALHTAAFTQEVTR